MHSVRRHELGVAAPVTLGERVVMHSVRRHELGELRDHARISGIAMHSVRRHELGVFVTVPRRAFAGCIPCGDMSWERS